MIDSDREAEDGPLPLPDLRWLLEMFSTPGCAVALRLQVGGFVVSGDAVPRSTWLRAFAGPRVIEDPVEQAWAMGLHEFADADDLEADLSGSRVRFEAIRVVHLVDVEVDPLVGDEVVEHAAYQVPLASIDGWALDRRDGRAAIRPGPGWSDIRRADSG